MLRAGVDGDGEVGAFLGAGLSDVAHSACSTCPPDRHMASSASSDSMYVLYFVLARFALDNIPLSSAGESSALTRAVFLMDLARIPNRRVERVSGSL
jgi:hypothetical protein